MEAANPLRAGFGTAPSLGVAGASSPGVALALKAGVSGATSPGVTSTRIPHNRPERRRSPSRERNRLGSTQQYRRRSPRSELIQGLAYSWVAGPASAGISRAPAPGIAGSSSPMATEASYNGMGFPADHRLSSTDSRHLLHLGSH